MSCAERPAVSFEVRAFLSPGPEITSMCAFFPRLTTTNVVSPDWGIVNEATRSDVSVSVTLTSAALVRCAGTTPVRASASSETPPTTANRSIVCGYRTVQRPPVASARS